MVRLEEKATQLKAMMAYMRAKLAWIEGDGAGMEPAFSDYEPSSRATKRRQVA
jgi:hypothetical protein